MSDSGRRFAKINSMTVYFNKTGELNGSSYVKISLRTNTVLNIENIDKYCFIWSILASLHPCNTNHLNRISNYKQYFDELNIQGFGFSKGFKSSEVHRFNKLSKLSINIFELSFYEDQKKWKHKLIPIEVSKMIQIELLTQEFTKIIMFSFKS